MIRNKIIPFVDFIVRCNQPRRKEENQCAVDYLIHLSIFISLRHGIKVE